MQRRYTYGKRYLSFETKLKENFDKVHFIFGAAGTSYFFAKDENHFFVFSDSGTLADFLDKKEDAELFDKLKVEYKFDDKSECLNFIYSIIKELEIQQNDFIIPEELL